MSLSRTLRQTLRSLTRQPALALSVIFTLALGIGASTALFAYLVAILQPALDAPQADRAVRLYLGTEADPRALASYADFADLARGQSRIVDLIASSPFSASVATEGPPTFGWGQMVSGGFFPFFAARPAAGRLLLPDDDRPGAEPVVVLSHALWKGAFGGDDKVIGRSLRINGVQLTVAGVAPPRFEGSGLTASLYVPLIHGDRITGLERFADRDQGFLQVLGRLAPRTSLAAARDAVAQSSRGLDEASPLASGPRRPAVIAARSFDPLWTGALFLDAARILLAAALLFLLVATINVANLLLARALGRQRELSIRASLGASRRKLAVGVVLESVVLSLAAGAVGWGLAVLLSARLESLVMTTLGGMAGLGAGSDAVRLDGRAFLFTFAASLLCAAACALFPVLRILREESLRSLTNDAQASGGGLGLRKSLVLVQIAAAVLLLVVGALLGRSLHSAARTEPGFATENLVAATLFVPRGGNASTDLRPTYRRVLDETAALGVEGACLTSAPPLAGWSRATTVSPSGDASQKVTAAFHLVSEGYFATLGIGIREGRPLDRRDGAAGSPSAVVSESLARRLWGTASPLGQLLRLDEPERAGEAGPVFAVVGVAADVRGVSVIEPPGPVLYLSAFQRTHGRMSLVLRTPRAPGALEAQVRNALARAHPDLAVVEFATTQSHLDKSLFQARLHAEVAGLFGLLGLAVAVVGLFGLLTYSVHQRRRELGIRMAVGASRRAVVALVVRQGMELAGLGLLLGIGASLAASEALRGLLFGVGTTDPGALGGAAAAVAGVALLASLVPARRAASVDPAAILKG